MGKDRKTCGKAFTNDCHQPGNCELFSDSKAAGKGSIAQWLLLGRRGRSRMKTNKFSIFPDRYFENAKINYGK